MEILQEQFNAFIDIYNKVEPSIKKTDSLEEKYSILKIPKGRFLSINEIENYLIEQVKELFTNKEIYNLVIHISDFNKLKQAFVYKCILEKTRKYCKYIDLLDTISGMLGHEIKLVPNCTESVWENVVRSAKNYLVISNSFCQLQRESYSKEINLGKSALYLKDLGCEVSIEDCSIILNEKKIAIKQITQRIKNIGGERFLKLLFSKLLYVKEFDRYLFLKQGNQPLRSKIEIEIPYAYLFNLGLQYIDSKGNPSTNFTNEFKELVEVAKHLCFVLYPVQSYSFWENIFHKTRNSLEYFRDQIIKGSLFEIPQCQASFAYQIWLHILNELNPDEFEKKIGYTVSDYKKVVQYILSQSKNTDSYTFYQNDLAKNIEINHNSLTLILDDLGQISKDINLGYLDPLDYSYITFWTKPLIRDKRGKYILLPKPITSFAFYEALVASLRKAKFREIDTTIGIYIEDYIKKELNKVGIKYSSGKYNDSIIGDGEADVIIETSKGIILIECKKKSLTRAAKSGNYYPIILDLAGSILDSQLQCTRSELVIRNNGQINIHDEVLGLATIRWDNRTIERVTFTFTDYGVLHDRIILNQILEELSSRSFNIVADESIDRKEFEKMQKKIDKISDTQKTLVSYINELGDRQPFFNTWFFNIHQFLFLINQCHNNEEFYDKMKEFKYVTMGSFDLYQEYFMRNLAHLYFK